MINTWAEKNISDRKDKEYSKAKKKMSRVQKLYETCKQIFANCGHGVVPCPENVERVKAVLAEADVGLRPNMPYLIRSTVSDGPPKIMYLHLHECDKFSIGIFCLPPSPVIPLHNHPGMTVFSKLFFGKMHIKSYDWVDNLLPHQSTPNANISNNDTRDWTGLRLAKLKKNSEFTAPCKTSILYPADGGNMHSFTARTACAVLDVLGPPYCDPEGRHCQYYYDFPFPNFSVDGLSVPEEQKNEYAWLKEREKPEDFTVDGALYSGPDIIVN
ncbi:PREDICTED: plant cysteine oxidase 2-like isoform X2 [Nicotiana attenuata]|uniref:cysteine dioxygenase n=1 Tax=Nicotiana attenuata TaxID=49451 RepID=A0A1J6I3K6_NICAT|nr:PREDICTED: plant cysteine oxidase 2-like isoform X2 [Nicotiana attenuata]OIS99637.1 plant cysteine oxidase 2 [Nicotiana attenuata]